MLEGVFLSVHLYIRFIFDKNDLSSIKYVLVWPTINVANVNLVFSVKCNSYLTLVPVELVFFFFFAKF